MFATIIDSTPLNDHSPPTQIHAPSTTTTPTSYSLLLPSSASRSPINDSSASPYSITRLRASLDIASLSSWTRRRSASALASIRSWTYIVASVSLVRMKLAIARGEPGPLLSISCKKVL